LLHIRQSIYLAAQEILFLEASDLASSTTCHPN